MNRADAIATLITFLRKHKHDSVSFNVARLKAQDLGLDIDAGDVIFSIADAGFHFVGGSAALICKDRTESKPFYIEN